MSSSDRPRVPPTLCSNGKEVLIGLEDGWAVTTWDRLAGAPGKRTTTAWGHLFGDVFARRPGTYRDKKAVPTWSPATFKGNERNNAACESVCALVLDSDDGATIEELKSVWGKYDGFIHSTWSHTPALAKFRVIIPYTRRVWPDEHDAIYAWALAESKAAGIVLDDTKDCARQFFFPSVRDANSEYITARLEGDRLDVDAVLAKIEAANPPPPPPPMPKQANPKAAPKQSSDRKAKYLNAALEKACNEVRTATSDRNKTLNKQAYGIAGLVGPGKIDADVAWDAFYDAASVHIGIEKFTESELRSTLNSAFRAGVAKPREIPEPAPRVYVAPANDAPAAPSNETSERPIVRINPDEKTVNDAVIAAIATHAQGVYQRGEQLVRIGFSDDAPHISPLPEPSLREIMADVVQFVTVKIDKSGAKEIHAHPPAWAVKAVAARGQWDGVPVLRAIVEAPVLRPDGSIVSRPGYDPPTRLYYAPSCDVPALPDHPTRDDAIRARDELLDVFHDFPYEKEVHRSAALAMTLTPFARFAFDGYVPMFTLDANLRGAGKSIQADVGSMIYTGRRMPRRAYVPDEVEMKKTVMSIAASGAWAVLFDNVAASLGGAALDMALTGESIEDRLFGRNDQTLRFKLSTIWMASGNNLVMHGDMIRRVQPNRLMYPGENPEDRDPATYRHPKLLEWVSENRPRLIAAALTILRAYFVAGRPVVKIKPWGSYEGWSSVVRAALVWCGMEDPRDACVDLTDSVKDLAARLIAGWSEAFPGSSGTIPEALKLLARPENQQRFETLRVALTELSGTPLERASALSLGKKLARYKDRVAGNQIFKQGKREERGNPWYVASVSTATTATRATAVDTEDAVDSHTVRVFDESVSLTDNMDCSRAVGSTAPTVSTATDVGEDDPQQWKHELSRRANTGSLNAPDREYPTAPWARKDGAA
jgi:hypothetical protein